MPRTRHRHIVVVLEAVEPLSLLLRTQSRRPLPMFSSAAPEVSRKLREVWRIHEALCILAFPS